MTNLTWLQKWYLLRCDGEWEHGSGIRICTLDNPGWEVRIPLRETQWEHLAFDNVERTGERDWFLCRMKDGYFEGFGGAENLDELLGVFRAWV